MNAYNVNKVVNYANHFNEKTTFKPIAGMLAHEMYLNNCLTAINTGTTPLIPGAPVAVTTANTSGSALVGLNPNCLITQSAGVGASDLGYNGIVLHNVTDFVLPSSTAPLCMPTQTTYIAMVGCNIDVYIPVDTTFTNVSTNPTVNSNGGDSYILLMIPTTNANGNVSYYTFSLQNTTTSNSYQMSVSYSFAILSNVVEGKQIYIDNDGNAGFRDCYVCKVRL